MSIRSIATLVLAYLLLGPASIVAGHETEHAKQSKQSKQQKHEYRYEYNEDDEDGENEESGEIDTDTTLAVRKGTRLTLTNFGGAVQISAWDRDAVQIQASHSARVKIGVRGDATALVIESSGRFGPVTTVDYQIQVPSWMPVEVSGINTDITVGGTRANVKAETVSGAISLTGGKGYIELGSLNGDVSVTGAQGRISVSAANDGVRFAGVDGEITVESVNGDIEFDNVHSSSIDAGTVNGEVRFSGPVLEGGRYRLATHNGDIHFDPSGILNAVVNVTTFNGDFESEFPVTIKEAKRGKRLSFTVGNGGPTVELESFQGTIRLGHAE